MNRRQMLRYAMPMIALIVRHVQRTGRRAEGECLALVVDVERMPVNDVVRVLLRQTVGERGERLAAVARAGDNEFAVDRITAFVFLGGDEPGGLRLLRM